MGEDTVTRRQGDASYFESVQHELAFAECLSARRLPLKFAYAGSAANTHDELAKSSGYKGVVDAASIEVRAIKSVVAGLRVHEIVELGPGNGDHSRVFLDLLSPNGIEVKRYLAMDFSRELLEIALGKVGSESPSDTSGAVW